MKDDKTKPLDLTQGVSDLEVADKIRDIQQSFETGKITRRSFMTSAIALGISLTAASAILNKVEAATPKKGGRLRVGLTGGATTDVLDPGQILDLYMIHLQFGQLRNGLTEVASDGQLTPELAESWEASSAPLNSWLIPRDDNCSTYSEVASKTWVSWRIGCR